MVHASERDRADVKAKRNTWSKMQRTMKAFSLVFLDESGVNTNLTRRYGRAQGKERVKDSAPLNTPKTTTIVSSVRLNGMTVYFVTLPQLIADLQKASVQGCLERRWRVYLRPDILIVDEVGYMHLTGNPPNCCFTSSVPGMKPGASS